MKIRAAIRVSWFPALVLAAWAYQPYVSRGPVLCIWRNLFGIECPGCGLTQALCSLVHGDVFAAASFNRLIFPVAFISAVVYCQQAVRSYVNKERMHG